MPPELDTALAAKVQAIADDHLSGASTLTRQAIAVLTDASAFGSAVVDAVAARLCLAQPAMASVWNAAAVAVGEPGSAAVQHFAAQVERAPRALARVFVRLLMTGRHGAAGGAEPLTIATISASESVRLCLEALAASHSVHVIAAEGRPLLEGRGMARELAAAGIAVTLCTDAAVGAVVDTHSMNLDAVVVGADAVAPQWFVNKCGTGQLVSSVRADSVPTYVVAGRDKFIGPALAASLAPGGGPGEEVWSAPPAGVKVANPYFERVALEDVAMFVTDVGAVGPAAVPDLCQSASSSGGAARLALLLRKG